MKTGLLFFPFLYVLEVTLGESGRWLSFGDVSIRKILFLISLVSLAALALLYYKRLRFARADAIVLAFLLVNLIWGLLIPTLRATDLALAFADFGNVLTLLLYFPLIALVRAKLVSWASVRRLFVSSA